MNDSKIIRWADRYIGTLICWMFNLLNVFKIKKNVKAFKNVLVIQLFEMGAGIMAYPSIKYIKEKLGEVNIYFLSTNNIKEVWELLNVVPSENILTINDKNLFTFATSLIKQIIYLRKREIDLVIDFQLFMRISSTIAFLVRPNQIAGFYRYGLEGLYRGNFYHFRCCYNQNMHISKNFLALTKTAINQSSKIPNYKDEIKTSEIEVPKYQSDPELKNLVQEQVKTMYPHYNDEDIILVCPDVGKILKVRNYPAEYFVEVISNLLNHYPNCLVLLIGVKENDETCFLIKNKVNNPRCVNFCDRLKSIRELIELMTLSKLLIANDNGPIHFASLTPIKVLTLFSPESPFVYGPLGNCVVLYSYFHCSPCINAFNHKSSCCRDNLCLKSVKPDRVFDYSVRLLEDKLKYRTVNNKVPYI